jgi:large subunit ribosomal protein L10
MDNPRPANVAVVEEVQQRFHDADGAILTEYRGLKVKDLAVLRRSLRSNGGDYKIYKNTLVRLAAKGSGLAELEPLLVGPTAIAFVDGDAAAVAKALRDYARTNPLLVLKGGVLGGKVLSAAETSALAELPSREVLLARFAGLLAAPLQQLAGLLQALPRNFAFGLAALRDQRAEEGGPDAPAEVAEGTPEPEAASADTADTTDTAEIATGAAAEVAPAPPDDPAAGAADPGSSFDDAAPRADDPAAGAADPAPPSADAPQAGDDRPATTEPTPSTE